MAVSISAGMRAALVKLRPADACLDGVEIGDARQRFLGDRRWAGGSEIEELPAGVAPTSGLADPRNTVGGSGAVDVAEAGEMRLRVRALLVRLVGRRRRHRVSRRAAVADMDPEPALTGAAAARVENRHRRFVAV